MKNRNLGSVNSKMLTGAGIMAALAIVVSFATSFIKIGYLSLDAGDIIIVLASFVYGPIVGVAISLVSSLVSMIYSGTMFWGMLMDFFSSAIFSFTASFIYRRRKSFNMAIIGIYSSVVVTAALMMPLNILITPLYTPVTTAFVLAQIPIMLLPFNFLKCLFNGGAVLLIYKPLVRALRQAKLVSLPSDCEPSERASRPLTNTKKSVILGSVTVLVASALLFVLYLLNR